jgi:ABC-type branched-subunit amino acid transport system substrate-binding protein
MHHQLKLLPLVAASLLWSGCGGRSATAPISVGHVASLSGPGKAEGEQAWRGIRLAVKEANQPEMRPFEVLHTDAGAKLESFEAEAVRLVAVNRVAALIGGTTTAEVERLDQSRTVVIGLTGNRTRAMSDLVFLTGLSPDLRGRALARHHLVAGLPAAVATLGLAVQAGPLNLLASLAAAEGSRSVVILADERREENLLVAEAFTRTLAAGETQAPTTWRTGKDADLPGLARRIAEQSPAAVLVVGEVDTVRRLRGLLPVLTLYFGGEDRGVLRQADGLNRIYLVTGFAANSPKAGAFSKAYQAAFNEAPGPDAALAYESAQLLFEGLRQIENPQDRSALAKALKSLKDFPGLCGPLAIEGNVLRRPAFVVRLEDGQPVLCGRFE